MHPVDGRSVCVRCIGGKHRANSLANAVFVLTGIRWRAHKRHYREECQVEPGCAFATREEIEEWANLHHTISHAAVLHHINDYRRWGQLGVQLVM